jgi:hypothetical protein
VTHTSLTSADGLTFGHDGRLYFHCRPDTAPSLTPTVSSEVEHQVYWVKPLAEGIPGR